MLHPTMVPSLINSVDPYLFWACKSWSGPTPVYVEASSSVTQKSGRGSGDTNRKGFPSNHLHHTHQCITKLHPFIVLPPFFCECFLHTIVNMNISVVKWWFAYKFLVEYQRLAFVCVSATTAPETTFILKKVEVKPCPSTGCLAHNFLHQLILCMWV